MFAATLDPDRLMLGLVLASLHQIQPDQGMFALAKAGWYRGRREWQEDGTEEGVFGGEISLGDGR